MFSIKLLRRLDADHDGKLSKAELAKGAEYFEELDLDRDGRLDAAEIMGAPKERNEPQAPQK